MSGIRFSINEEDAKKFLDALKKEASETLENIMLATAFYIEGQARIYAPKDNSDLAKSIVAKKVEDEPFSYTITAQAPYAAYQEFGTRFGPEGVLLTEIPEELKELALTFKVDNPKRFTNIHAQPYMYPALLDGRRFLVQQIQKEYEDL